MSLLDLDIGVPESVADWIETSLIVCRSGRIALDRLVGLANSELNVPEERIARALRVMSNRAAILEELYPFEVVEGIAVRRRDSRLANAYATLLFLTPRSLPRLLLKGMKSHQMATILEGVAVRALSNFWGPGGDAVSFAYPSEVGRPPEFDQAVLWLARQIGIEPGRGYRPPRRKDGGVDVVAWRRFRDRRQGFPIALAQCTIQQETFTKTTDIDVRLWSTWLAMDTDPTSMLVLPGTIKRAGPEWSQLSSVVLVIDRLRLMELLGRVELPDLQQPWTDAAIEGLSEILAATEY